MNTAAFIPTRITRADKGTRHIKAQGPNGIDILLRKRPRSSRRAPRRPRLVHEPEFVDRLTPCTPYTPSDYPSNVKSSSSDDYSYYTYYSTEDGYDEEQGGGRTKQSQRTGGNDGSARGGNTRESRSQQQRGGKEEHTNEGDGKTQNRSLKSGKNNNERTGRGSGSQDADSKNESGDRPSNKKANNQQKAGGQGEKKACADEKASAQGGTKQGDEEKGEGKEGQQKGGEGEGGDDEGVPKPDNVVPDDFQQTRWEGLSAQEAADLLQEHGPNEVAKEKVPLWKKLLPYFVGPIPFMIEIAAIMSIVTLEYVDFIIITCLLFFNCIVGYAEERQAGNAVEALSKTLALNATVKRDGQYQEIEAREVVPGDIVVLKAGTIVPADCVVIGDEQQDEEQAVAIDESALTGESLPQEKHIGDVTYSSSLVRSGQMQAQATKTGANSFVGQTTALVSKAGSKSHLRQYTTRLGNLLLALALIAVLIEIGVGASRHDSGVDVTRNVLVLIIASIPIALPTVSTVTMAVGARQMARHNAIVTKLSSIEELASVNVLCTDKTGTLTLNRLTRGDPKLYNDATAEDALGAARIDSHNVKDPIDRIFLSDVEGVPKADDDDENGGRGGGGDHTPAQQGQQQQQQPPGQQQQAGQQQQQQQQQGGQQQQSDQQQQQQQQQTGQQPSAQPQQSGQQQGSQQQGQQQQQQVGGQQGQQGPGETPTFNLPGYEVTHTMPFDSNQKRTETTAVGSSSAYYQGEITVSKGAVKSIMELCELSGDMQERVTKLEEEQSAQGYRSLAVARKTEKDAWSLLAVFPVYDPPRPDSADVIKQCVELGLNVKMLTGDQVAIGVETARQLGMGTNIRNAEELDGADEEEIKRIVVEADGFGGVKPEHKHRIVKVLQDAGYRVAMTGDGVNDAPAIKQADCGIAVSNATDSARAAAAIVMQEPGLGTLVVAIQEGRRIFQRIRSYSIYRLVTSFQIVVVLTALFVWDNFSLKGFEVILLAVFNDVATITLAHDKAVATSAPPRWKLAPQVWLALVLSVFMMGSSLVVYGVGRYVLALSIADMQTAMYLQLAVSELLVIFASRVSKGFFWQLRPGLWLLAAIVIAVVFATIISGFGALVDKLRWRYVGYVWAVDVVAFLLLDLTYRIIEPRILPQEKPGEPAEPEEQSESIWGHVRRVFGARRFAHHHPDIHHEKHLGDHNLAGAARGWTGPPRPGEGRSQAGRARQGAKAGARKSAESGKNEGNSEQGGQKQQNRQQGGQEGEGQQKQQAQQQGSQDGQTKRKKKPVQQQQQQS